MCNSTTVAEPAALQDVCVQHDRSSRLLCCLCTCQHAEWVRLLILATIQAACTRCLSNAVALARIVRIENARRASRLAFRGMDRARCVLCGAVMSSARIHAAHHRRSFPCGEGATARFDTCAPVGRRDHPLPHRGCGRVRPLSIGIPRWLRHHAAMIGQCMPLSGALARISAYASTTMTTSRRAEWPDARAMLTAPRTDCRRTSISLPC